MSKNPNIVIVGSFNVDITCYAERLPRHGETVFLDDVSIDDVERALGRRVVVVEQDGYCLADALFAQEEGE